MTQPFLITNSVVYTYTAYAISIHIQFASLSRLLLLLPVSIFNEIKFNAFSMFTISATIHPLLQHKSRLVTFVIRKKQIRNYFCCQFCSWKSLNNSKIGLINVKRCFTQQKRKKKQQLINEAHPKIHMILMLL